MMSTFNTLLMEEKNIESFKVDGYKETTSSEKIAYEFHGCFWHGCPKCFSRSTVNPVNDTTMGDLHYEDFGQNAIPPR